MCMLLYGSRLRDPRVSLKWRKEEAEDAVPFRRSTVSLAVFVFLLPAPLPPFPSEAEQLASQMATPQTPLAPTSLEPTPQIADECLDRTQTGAATPLGPSSSFPTSSPTLPVPRMVAACP